MNKLFKIMKSFFKEDKIIFFEDSKVEMDSRKVERGDIFFAINNGNDYIEEVLLKNPSLIISDLKDIKIKDDRIFYVEDTVKTMQNIATLYREELLAKVIGITGSNGKTTTKDILFSVMTKVGKTKKTFGNYNNHIGLPFTLLTTGEDIEYLILEMGMDTLGEIDTLCRISRPDYGIITNIGLSHISNLKNRETVFLAKTEMLKYIKSENMFVNSDDDLLKEVISNQVGFNEEEFLKSRVKTSSYTLSNLVETEGEQTFLVTKNGEENSGRENIVRGEVTSFKLNLNGAYNTLNAGLVIALAQKLGTSTSLIQEGLLAVELTPMRFEKKVYDKVICINDAYNASPVSMLLGINLFEKIYAKNYKIAIIADMLELGTDELSYHEEIIKKIIASDIEEILLYGTRMLGAYRGIENKDIKVKEFSEKRLLIEYMTEKLKNIKKDSREAAVFFKASRGMKLEEIINAVFDKSVV